MGTIKVLETIIHDADSLKVIDNKADELGYSAALGDFYTANVKIKDKEVFRAEVFIHDHLEDDSEVIETIREINGKKLYGLYRIK